MDRLTRMKVFVRVVQLGGFTAAAEASNISPTMVSNHIRALERHLGARLLNRTTRHQSVTEIGAAYFAECVSILARVDTAEDRARDMHSRPKGQLRISAPVTFGSHFLVPVLGEYLRSYVDIEIDLQLNDKVVDLAREGFDAAFRLGNLRDSSLIARPLGNLSQVICASPGYLGHRGTPRVPNDLIGHNCLSFHCAGPERDWVFHGTKTTTIRVSGQLIINNEPALLQTALSDVGIAMLPEYLVGDHIAAGDLVRLFAEYEFSRGPVQLVYLPDRDMTVKLKTFVDFVLAGFGQQQPAKRRAVRPVSNETAE